VVIRQQQDTWHCAAADVGSQQQQQAAPAAHPDLLQLRVMDLNLYQLASNSRHTVARALVQQGTYSSKYYNSISAEALSSGRRVTHVYFLRLLFSGDAYNMFNDWRQLCHGLLQRPTR
jgi:hypothetical protein